MKLSNLAQPASPERRPLRDSVLWKLFVIGLLILALLVPLSMVRSLVRERWARHDEAAREVASTWGGRQTIGGPVLTVPFRVHLKDDAGKVTTATELAQFLPEALRIDGRVLPEKRSRGIYEVVLYRAELNVAGIFARPDFAEWRVPPEDVLWEDAFLTVGVPDMRGIRRGIALQWRERKLQLAPGGADSHVWDSGLRAPLPNLAAGKVGETYPFEFQLGINGSGRLMFLPFGKETTVKLRSSWPDPSFTGAFLPEGRNVTGAGFDAAWSVSYFGRPYPQQWREAETARLKQPLPERGAAPEWWSSVDGGRVGPSTALEASAFGVELLLPVDAYQKTERSVKYAVLFLLLTFVTFFLYEVFNPVSLHPMQYLLVGSALCLFYLLLLSIAEHAPFGLAYVVASGATAALIGSYSAAILRGRARALLMAAILGVLYGYLYILLQAEDYALLLGAIGLFLILALVMYVTRRIDWYAPRAGRGGVEVTAVQTAL